MEVALIALADSANVSAEGKLNLFGVFDTIRASNFPVLHSSMVVAVRLRMESEDQLKTHKVKISMIDEDSREIFTVTAQVKVSKIRPGQFIHANQIIQLHNTPFEKAGMPLHLLQRQLGHKHITMTMRYAAFHPNYNDVAGYFDRVEQAFGLGAPVPNSVPSADDAVEGAIREVV